MSPTFYTTERPRDPFYELRSITTGEVVDERTSTTTCPKTGAPLTVFYDFGYVSARLNRFALRNAPPKGTKYLDLYPIRQLDAVVSLDEGGTPLVKANALGRAFGLGRLYIKNETTNPTGVFKDRGSLVDVTKAKELGADAVCVASTGNMAASVAAYCSVAGLPCYVLIPEGTPIGKLAQALSYGARMLQIRGTYDDAARLAAEMARRHNFYLAGDYAFRSEGQKSQGFEIIEQLGWRAPEWIVVPMGCGTNLAAIWKGCAEYHRLGLVEHVPKMIGVQPDGCAPIVEALGRGGETIARVERPNTIASAVAAGWPLDGIKALRAIRDSGGTALAVSDDEILRAQQELAHSESIFVEPSGALPFAAVPKLVAAGLIGPDDTVVCIATGTGLKDPRAALRVLPSAPTIEPVAEEVDRYLDMRLYEIRGAGVGEGRAFAPDELLDRARLGALLSREFGANLSDEILDRIHASLVGFHEKGKVLSRRDLQYVLSEAVRDLTPRDNVLKVLDFQITTGLHRQAEANVTAEFLGRRIESSAAGVGPVDAVINVLRAITASAGGLTTALNDYNVEINTGGTDATVSVTMALRDEEGRRVVSNASSPDIVVASVKAFVEGYNILFAKSKAS